MKWHTSHSWSIQVRRPDVSRGPFHPRFYRRTETRLVPMTKPKDRAGFFHAHPSGENPFPENGRSVLYGRAPTNEAVSHVDHAHGPGFPKH